MRTALRGHLTCILLVVENSRSPAKQFSFAQTISRDTPCIAPCVSIPIMQTVCTPRASTAPAPSIRRSPSPQQEPEMDDARGHSGRAITDLDGNPAGAHELITHRAVRNPAPPWSHKRSLPSTVPSHLGLLSARGEVFIHMFFDIKRLERQR